jgi:small subunit ribosomal protein S5
MTENKEKPQDKEKDKSALSDIKGLGEKSLSELKDAGITNIEELAGADLGDLAEKTGLSEKRLSEWQTRAKAKLPGVVEEELTVSRGEIPDEEVVVWVPKTQLGKLVHSGQINDINEIFQRGEVIKEVGIIDKLLPGMSEEIISVGRVQRVTDSGRRMRFRVVAAVGNGNGFIGIGEAKGKEAGPTIRKAIERAKMCVNPVKRGCGSWECGCGNPHTVPFKVIGKAGSVVVELLPAPRGMGLAAGALPRKLLALAGVTDVWLRSYGFTRTNINFAHATYNALVNTNRVKLKPDDVKNLNVVSGAVEKKITLSEGNEQ